MPEIRICVEYFLIYFSCFILIYLSYYLFGVVHFHSSACIELIRGQIPAAVAILY